MDKITMRKAVSFIVGIIVLIGYAVMIPYGPILFSGCDRERFRSDSYPEIRCDDGTTLRTRIDCLIYDQPSENGKVIWELPAGYPVRIQKRGTGELDGWVKVSMEIFSRPTVVGWVRLTRRNQ